MTRLKTTLFASAALLGAAAYVQVPHAVALEPADQIMQGANQNVTTMPAPAERALEKSSPAEVERRIAALHDKLHITPNQKGKWDDVASAMRETAKDIRSKLGERQEKDAKSGTVTAVDDLRTYHDLLQAQADGSQRMIGPFEALYNAMSPEQKKIADALFARPHSNEAHPGKSAS